MDTTNSLVNIQGSIEAIANKYAEEIGWGRNLKKFSESCIYCTRHCHYSRHPEVQQKFWNDVLGMLAECGVNAEPIQKALQQKLLQMPWDRVIPYKTDDILQLIAEQLGNHPDEV